MSKSFATDDLTTSYEVATQCYAILVWAEYEI